MSIDELKLGFERLAIGVVPAEDPYGRLLARARRRNRRRVVVVSAVFVAIATAVFAVALPVRPAPNVQRVYPVTNPWIWRLIDGPTRGDLAGNGPLLRAIVADAEERNPDPALQTKVLFAGLLGARVVAVVARFSATAAAIDTVYGQSSADGGDITVHGGQYGTPPAPVVTARSLPIGGSTGLATTLVLAPPGCLVSTNDGLASGMDWSVAATRDWAAIPDPGPPIYRVSCQGAIKQQTPLSNVDVLPPYPVRTDVDRPSVGDLAITAYHLLAAAVGLPGDAHVAWTGRIPSEVIELAGREVAVVIGDNQDRPVLVYINGPSPSAQLAVGRVGDGPPRPDAAEPDRLGLVATGDLAAGDLPVVRLPHRVAGHAVTGQDVLVVVPPGTTDVIGVDKDGYGFVYAHASGPVEILPLLYGEAGGVRALDANGTVLAESYWTDSDLPVGHLFGLTLVYDWH